MRTTLTLDPDVSEKIRQETSSGKTSLKKLINEKLRIGFGITPRKKSPKFIVKPHASDYYPGIDPMKFNQLLDDMEAEEFLKKSGQRKMNDHSGC